ncbi:2,3-diketo-5-methylthio-1-phosphopentane phosphatase [Oscillatoriales cyanobacterium USR001]|nr:2,3-diketo-5-methylthio-1-phosphopentane phosphatase [Oscillatoriales cyanobacterium USR001]
MQNNKDIKKPKAILTDIEGTTSSSSFFSEVLFPYSRSRLGSYCMAHPEKTADILSEVEAIEPGDPITTLERWIDENQKFVPLKTLQGLIWAEGFYEGAFKGHIYTDVQSAFRLWHANGITLYIFSAASISAQKLLFGFSEVGDLTPILSGYFDTSTGSKREANSYRLISEKIGLMPTEVLFLSDTSSEVEAARNAGMSALHIDRTNGLADISTFGDIKISL